MYSPVCVRGAPIAQLGEHQTLDRKVAGSILTWGRSVSLTLHCLILVKPRKPFQNDCKIVDEDVKPQTKQNRPGCKPVTDFLITQLK